MSYTSNGCVCNGMQVPKRPDIESLAAACRCTAAHQRSSRIQCARQALAALHKVYNIML